MQLHMPDKAKKHKHVYPGYNPCAFLFHLVFAKLPMKPPSENLVLVDPLKLIPRIIKYVSS